MSKSAGWPVVVQLQTCRFRLCCVRLGRSFAGYVFQIPLPSWFLFTLSRIWHPRKTLMQKEGSWHKCSFQLLFAPSSQLLQELSGTSDALTPPRGVKSSYTLFCFPSEHLDLVHPPLCFLGLAAVSSLYPVISALFSCFSPCTVCPIPSIKSLHLKCPPCEIFASPPH